MAYEKTEWENGTGEPINADNLNKIEQGIEDAHTDIDNLNESVSNLESSKLNSADFKTMFKTTEESKNPYDLPRTVDKKTQYYTTGAGQVQKAGYYPLGIVGWNISGDNSSYVSLFRCDLDSRSYENGVGKATINYAIRLNNTSVKYKGTIMFEILWIKYQ